MDEHGRAALPDIVEGFDHGWRDDLLSSAVRPADLDVTDPGDGAQPEVRALSPPSRGEIWSKAWCVVCVEFRRRHEVARESCCAGD
jgi:hypothetical protein